MLVRDGEAQLGRVLGQGTSGGLRRAPGRDHNNSGIGNNVIITVLTSRFLDN